MLRVVVTHQASTRVSGSIQFIIPVGARVRGTDAVVLDPTPLVLGAYYLRVPPKVVALYKKRRP